MTEAAQSRAGHISGAREDISLPALRCQERPRDWFDHGAPRVPFGDLPSSRFDDVRDDLRDMVAALADVGLSEVVAVDLSHPDVPLPVIKVIVPGAEPPLELWDRSRISLGWRARRVIERLPGGDNRR